jgi:hypothetical protein
VMVVSVTVVVGAVAGGGMTAFSEDISVALVTITRESLANWNRVVYSTTHNCINAYCLCCHGNWCFYCESKSMVFNGALLTPTHS